MAKDRTIEVVGEVSAPPAEIYRMLTNSTHLREWLADWALAKPHEDGPVYFEWNDGNAATGRFTRLEPDKQVAFTWRETDEPDHTHVEVELTATASGTEVTVRHSGFAKGKASKRARKALAQAWTSALENLASVMATGEDLRFTRRPMLGIQVDEEIGPHQAAERKLPVSHGIAVSAVVAGMGAEAAGLKAGDVLVRLGDADVMDWGTLGAALQPHRAGDTVEIQFYRDRQEQTAAMELSARPMPEVPNSATALADYLRKMYAELNSELWGCFEGVSEEEAGRKPSPDEWSGKEVLAHLLDGERDSHGEITELILGRERLYDSGFGNSDLRVAVTAWSYPRVAEMLSALSHSQEQTLSLVSQLPAPFVARRSSFWRLAYNYTQTPDHNAEHLAQIRAALGKS